MKFNLAQHLYMALGVDALRLAVRAYGKQPSHTKKGPGRKHTQGGKRA